MGDRRDQPRREMGRARQAAIFLDGVAGRRPRVPVDMGRLEERARAVMSREGFAYVAGGAGQERTMAANAIGALDALPGVVAAVAGRVPVLFDSGIRGGADIFKGLALVATSVCLGPPYVYGLAIARQVGVQEVIRNVLAELDLTMGLVGCTSLHEITREMLLANEATDNPR